MHPRKSLLFFQFEDKVYQFVKQAGFIRMQFCSMLQVSVMDHNVDRLRFSAQWTSTHREILCFQLLFLVESRQKLNQGKRIQ
jgi:hypothetical protein